MKLICEIFKSPRKDEMYLYVDKTEGMERVPEALLEVFGRPVSVTTMLITPEKKLARAEADKVMKEIRANGFYLQMPPAKDDYLLDLYKAPTESKY